MAFPGPQGYAVGLPIDGSVAVQRPGPSANRALERATFSMHDPDAIRELVLEAGRMAMAMRPSATIDRKADASFVTSADLAVQEYLIAEIGKRCPDDGFVAEEEGVGRSPQAARRLWVLDPIDGTASYALGLPGWGVSVGLVEDGRAVEGWFYEPVMDEMFNAGPDRGMRYQGEPARVLPDRPADRDTSIFVDSRFHQRLALDPSFPGKARSLGTTVGHLAYVASGRTEAAVVQNVHAWDFAAGQAMLIHAGGVLRYLDGSDVDMTDYLAGEATDRVMVGGHPDTVAQVSAAIREQ